MKYLFTFLLAFLSLVETPKVNAEEGRMEDRLNEVDIEIIENMELLENLPLLLEYDALDNYDFLIDLSEEENE